MSTLTPDSDAPTFGRLARETLAEGHAIRFTARGSSMTPFVRDGDVLTVEPAREPHLHIGDIVLYAASADRLIAHRLQERHRGTDGLTLLIRGDNQVETDRVSAQQILGRAVAVQRGARVYRPALWANRALALACTRCRRHWRRLFGRPDFNKPDHA